MISVSEFNPVLIKKTLFLWFFSVYSDVKQHLVEQAGTFRLNCRRLRLDNAILT
jgi:hypothetical protein